MFSRISFSVLFLTWLGNFGFSHASDTCPDEFRSIKSDDKTIYVSQTEMKAKITWFDAFCCCQSFGYQLFSPKRQHEYQQVFSQLANGKSQYYGFFVDFNNLNETWRGITSTPENGLLGWTVESLTIPDSVMFARLGDNDPVEMRPQGATIPTTAGIVCQPPESPYKDNCFSPILGTREVKGCSKENIISYIKNEDCPEGARKDTGVNTTPGPPIITSSAIPEAPIVISSAAPEVLSTTTATMEPSQPTSGKKLHPKIEKHCTLIGGKFSWRCYLHLVNVFIGVSSPHRGKFCDEYACS